MPKRFVAVEHAAQADFENIPLHDGVRLVGDRIGKARPLGDVLATAA